ncbi:hypothetical protein [Neobacillus niacini]|uniref:hypothetical protein n=1 Tax=Neobacillus niacini TaxID=86668 RepID=UPI0037C5A658
MAVPIKDFFCNTVAAISISGPEFRIHGKDKKFYLPNLLSTGNEISEYCDL